MQITGVITSLLLHNATLTLRLLTYGLGSNGARLLLLRLAYER